uniref:VQ domain-containing protein n=1 Tax=Oryza brachyantha TaxID=4533 RepID=J3MPK0_ORYBR
MEERSSSSSQRGGSREMQGPRPAPLKVSKDSHKIRKPQQLRQPVIIYTMSPKVVHANPADFMSVVQRLTGAPRTTAPPATLPLFAQPQSSSFPFQLQDAWPLEAQQQHSPAAPARLASIEQAAARSSSGGDHAVVGLPPLPSILSPVPGSLPAIPASFFSPPATASALGELISPPFLGAAPSPSPMGGAGAYYWDIFNNINIMQHQQQQYHHQN